MILRLSEGTLGLLMLSMGLMERRNTRNKTAKKHLEARKKSMKRGTANTRKIN